MIKYCDVNSLFPDKILFVLAQEKCDHQLTGSNNNNGLSVQINRPVTAEASSTTEQKYICSIHQKGKNYYSKSSK